MPNLKWWQKAIFYQIYPRSFADSDADGIGDLLGMTSRLDYLQSLGVDAVWLSPHYPSPLYDCGYDISDYMAIASEYGTMDDFRRFLDGLHSRGMRLITDLVLNHTSSQHAWFQESSTSLNSRKRDWYIWQDGKEGGPPNNWYSIFGGSAWEYDPRTDQYYYHFFFKEQPDLNWSNPEVKEAMFAAARFWLDLGVDGFRLDAIGTIFEDPNLPDHESSLTQAQLYHRMHTTKSPADQLWLNEEWDKMYGHQVDQPGIHELMKELRLLVDQYDDRVLVGETDDITYYGSGEDELHMVFNFPLMRTEHMTPAWVRDNQEQRLSTLPQGAWPCNTLNNHDSPRVYSRYGDGTNNEQIARISLALMLTLRGTPFLYYGEEIGMTDYLLQDLEQFCDFLGVWVYHLEQEILGAYPAEALAHAAQYSRDKCRTPMQWSRAPNGGFSPEGVQTWLPVNPNYADGVNVADQDGRPGSLLNFYRRMIKLRKSTPALIAGSYISLHSESEDYLAFLRHSPQDGQTCLVVLNMSAQPLVLHFEKLDELAAGLDGKRARLLFSNYARKSVEQGQTENPRRLAFEPYEIFVAELGKLE